MSQNYPNPFNPSTAISYQLPALSRVEGPAVSFVKLGVYEFLGREVATLANENRMPVTYIVHWDASDFPSGIYFYRLWAGEYTVTRKMVLVK